MLTCGKRLGATRPPSFLRQFRLARLFPRRFCLGFRPRLSDGSRLFWRSCYRCRLQWPRRPKTGGRKIPRQAQLLRKLLLPAKSRSRFRNLVRDRPLRSFFNPDPEVGALKPRETPAIFLCLIPTSEKLGVASTRI